MSEIKKTGKVTLVGFGPGNPELLTIAAVKALEEADVIFYDALIDTEYLDHFTAEKISVGKRSGRHSAEQEQINQLLAETAMKGQNVIRLKGGDPMLFGRAGEEIRYLRERDIPVSVIPGVTTASALAADTLTSLTVRGISQSVAFINGHADLPLTPDAQTLVYYMGARKVKQIANALIDRGKDPHTPALLVYNASLKDEKIFRSTIGQLATEDRKYPTPLILLIGKVANTIS